MHALITLPSKPALIAGFAAGLLFACKPENAGSTTLPTQDSSVTNPDGPLVHACLGSLELSDAELEQAQAEAQAACEEDTEQCLADQECLATIEERECNIDAPITYEVVLSQAVSAGLSDTFEAARMELVYDYDSRRVIWVLRTVLVYRGPLDGCVGEVASVDALTGEVFELLGWLVVP